MDNFRCIIERITYQNEDNGYTVLKCRAKGYSDLVTVVGSFPEVHVGSVLTMSGFWKVDAKYGRQFSMVSFEETLPASVVGIEKYLGSGRIKGIGPKFAQKITKQNGLRREQMTLQDKVHAYANVKHFLTCVLQGDPQSGRKRV